MVDILVADRVIGVHVVPHRPEPFLVGILQIKHLELGSVGCDFADRNIVKFKNILDNLVGFLINNTLFTARIRKHPDVVFRHFLVLFVGVDPQKAQHTVGRYGQKPHKRRENHGNKPNGTGQFQRDGLRLAHGNALGDQFAEHQCDKGQNNRNHDHRQRIQRCPGKRDLAVQRVDNHAAEAFRRKRTAQKAGKRDGDLDGCKKFGGVIREPFEFFCTFVAVVSQFVKLRSLCLDHRDFRAGKDSVQCDQSDLNDDLQP